MIINGEGLIMGRLASLVSKKLLNGEEIIILNAEKIIISGNKEWAYAKYKQRLDRASISNPRKMGPKFPRRPEDIFRRAVRGMLPYRKTSGREAYKRLKVFVGIPDAYEESEMFEMQEAKAKHIKKGIELGKMSRLLGSKFEA